MHSSRSMEDGRPGISDRKCPLDVLTLASQSKVVLKETANEEEQLGDD